MEDCLFLTLTQSKFHKFLSIAPELKETFQSMVENRTANSLKTIPIFQDLKENKPWNKLELLATLFKYEKFAAGDVLFKQGDPGDKFYVILYGTVSVTEASVGGAVVSKRKMSNGEFFGEISLLKEGIRTATVTALEPCTLLTLTKESFDKFLSIMPEAKQLLTEQVQRIHNGKI